MKNLSKHKDKVNARELLVQALYEFSFGHNDAKSIEESFRKDFTKTKVAVSYTHLTLPTTPYV